MQFHKWEELAVYLWPTRRKLENKFSKFRLREKRVYAILRPPPPLSARAHLTAKDATCNPTYVKAASKKKTRRLTKWICWKTFCSWLKKHILVAKSSGRNFRLNWNRSWMSTLTVSVSTECRYYFEKYRPSNMMISIALITAAKTTTSKIKSKHLHFEQYEINNFYQRGLNFNLL